jgi:alpha-beta hydrolase superfamily lysophospholipase
VKQFGYQNDWAFAWDARGHGYSPGERGDAPSFHALVQDFNVFIQHIQDTYAIAPEKMVIVANSVGAVIAATWLRDYAPRVRGVVMAAAAFDINLYVPLARPALRLATCFKPDLFVTSYIRSSMLTHSREQAAA